MADKYYPEPTVVTTDKGTATIWHPILTEEERSKRMELLKKACVSMMQSTLEAAKTNA